MAGGTVGVPTAVAGTTVVVTVEGATIAGIFVVADGTVDVASAVVGTAVAVTGSDGLVGAVVVVGPVVVVGAVVGRPRKGPVIS